MGLRESNPAAIPPARALRLVKPVDAPAPTLAAAPAKAKVIYPDTDGKPMAESTDQYDWMTLIKFALESLYRGANVFVAGDLLWYPVEDNNKICRAPDVMLVFGRPAGRRSSYVQCEEDNLPPQVVFEIRSHTNTNAEMADKLAFYDTYGVEEYYVWDPADASFKAYVRSSPGASLLRVAQPNNFVSPRMGVRMEVLGDELALWGPDGKRLLNYHQQVDRAEIAEERAQAERERAQAERGRAQAAEALAQAERERAQAAEALAQAERERAAAIQRRLEELEEKLRAQGIDPV